MNLKSNWEKIMYGNGLAVGMISRGILFSLLFWIYEIVIVASANELGFISLILFWLPSLPFIFIEGISKNYILILSTFMWFIIGAVFNLIMYGIKNKQ